MAYDIGVFWILARLIKQLELVLGNYGFSLKLSLVFGLVKSWARSRPHETANFIKQLQVFWISVGSLVLVLVGAAGPIK